MFYKNKEVVTVNPNVRMQVHGSATTMNKIIKGNKYNIITNMLLFRTIKINIKALSY